YDFTGPPVGGDRTDRHLGLVWGDVPGDGTLHMFRGAKLRLVDVPPGLITEAMRPGHHLAARVRLTDDNGNPVCARLRPPHLTWSAEPTGPPHPRGSRSEGAGEPVGAIGSRDGR